VASNTFSKSVVILFSGKAGVGKTTCAQRVYDIYSKEVMAKIAPIATGVKLTAQNSFGWDNVKDGKGRKLLQNIGQAGREYNENIWVELMFEHLLPADKRFPFDLILVDDWRFPNEYDFISNRSMYRVYRARILAPEREILKDSIAYNDISETSLDDYQKFEFVLDNTKSKEHLYNQLDGIMSLVVSENTY